MTRSNHIRGNKSRDLRPSLIGLSPIDHRSLKFYPYIATEYLIMSLRTSDASLLPAAYGDGDCVPEPFYKIHTKEGGGGVCRSSPNGG